MTTIYFPSLNAQAQADVTRGGTASQVHDSRTPQLGAGALLDCNPLRRLCFRGHRMSATKGNAHASKPADERADSHLHIRVKRADKARWVKAADGRKLSAWVVESLNNAAK